MRIVHIASPRRILVGGDAIEMRGRRGLAVLVVTSSKAELGVDARRELLALGESVAGLVDAAGFEVGEAARGSGGGVVGGSAGGRENADLLVVVFFGLF